MAYKHTWDEWYELACQYAKDHNGSIATIFVTYKTSEGYKLGTWVYTQRQAYQNRNIPKEKRNNTSAPLTDEQVRKLEAIGMVWKVIKTWDDWYNIACEYAKNNNGSIALISTEYVTEQGDKLGTWISNQRLAYKNRTIPKEQRKNTSAPLTDEQVRKLENIGMDWQKRQIVEKTWDEWYELSCEYAKNNNGSIALISTKYVTEQGDKLGTWIDRQRQAYQNRSISKEERKKHLLPLTDEQVRKLETIGIIWEVIKTWDEWYEIAYTCAKEHNGSIASISTLYITKEGDSLGAWIHHQRQAYKNRFIPEKERKNGCKPLTDEQVQKLEAIGMIWNKLENTNKIFEFCENYNIDFNKNKKILKSIPASFLEAKITYCLKNDIPITIDGNLNEIFTMSSANLYAEYGISIEELMSKHKLSLEKR